MNWLEVQSSNVAAIAYDADIATLAVRYKDGAVYVRPNVTATQFGALMTAPSKGKFLAAMSGQAIRIEKGIAEDSQSKERAAPLATENTGPLNVLDEDAGKCCRKQFDTHPPVANMVMHCRECGTEFRPEMVGPVRHWRIVEHIAIVRPRG
jgi:KTSC domain